MFDGFTSLEGGMDANSAPSLLQPNQSAFLGNVSLRGDYASSRSPFIRKILSFDSAEFLETKDPLYAIVSGQDVQSKKTLQEWHFVLIQRFSDSTLQRLGYLDPFTNANFPVEIYRRG